MKALRKRVLAKRAQAAAKGETEAHDDESYAGEPEDDAAPAVVGPRNQPASRGRGRGRPSGKRR
jgi:preprotein translocase subunit SecF